MKAFTISAAVALALALPAFGQDITSLPQCAQSPILNAISSSGCGLTDIGCICGNSGFVDGLVKLIPTLCTPDEVKATEDFAVSLCQAYGVTLDLPDPSSLASSASAPAATSAASSVASSISSAASSASSAASTSATASPTTVSAETSSSAPASTTEAPSSTEAAASAASSAAPSTFTGAAVKGSNAGLTGLVGAVAVGLLAVA